MRLRHLFHLGKSPPRRRWFYDQKTDTYYRNCPTILQEAKEAMGRGDTALATELHAEFDAIWSEGLVRKSTLGSGEVLVQRAPMRDAYPHLPGLWFLDDPT
jgi:hypothetical protein